MVQAAQNATKNSAATEVTRQNAVVTGKAVTSGLVGLAQTADIVGLWDVQFIADGQVVDEGFDQYHSDGTEILNDTPPPAAGNVCLGVYRQVGGRTIKLRHPSWLYDSTNTVLIGKVTILETVTVDKSGLSFTGTFTIQFANLDGHSLGPDLTGQLKATRILPI
jgi:hypothetical protein